MNGPGLLELLVIGLLVWILLGAGRECRGDRAFPLGAVGKRSEEEQLRAAAERLGLKTDGLDEVELRTALQTRLSNE